ncbi:uncharacterized protein LOC34617677 [Cyclospora cayetanensis]|uniref:rRNA biogenesis protein RRP36 n=1 Tax=Cyclospora cayetanensis TaxID=88456 RepID=A0A6P6S1T0_9EIME|nr:uncharacterized protein LOC34617677 [Cyclospora cayetanensis]
MRGAAQRLTLQELRRLQQKATTEAVGSTNVNVDSEGAERGVGTEEPQQKGNGPSGKTLDTFKKGRAATKVKNRSNNKAPREFGCRRRVRTHGALVLPDGEAAAGPLLLAAAPVASAATRSPTATTPEVEAYRKAVAAHQLRKLRGGLEQRSAGAKSRDPRFSSLCGDLNVSSCSKAYAFVEEQQQQLMRQLQRVVRTGRVPEGTDGESSKGRKASAAEREQAAKQLQKLESQQQQRERRAATAALKATLSRSERERIAATGKTPHYVSRRKLRELLREQQMQSRSSKKQTQHEVKACKKTLAKERKRNFIPQRRAKFTENGQ